MTKFERQNQRILMVGLIVIGIILCIDAATNETPCCPKGGQLGAGLSMLMLAYVGWPITPDSHE